MRESFPKIRIAKDGVIEIVRTLRIREARIEGEFRGVQGGDKNQGVPREDEIRGVPGGGEILAVPGEGKVLNGESMSRIKRLRPDNEMTVSVF